MKEFFKSEFKNVLLFFMPIIMFVFLLLTMLIKFGTLSYFFELIYLYLICALISYVLILFYMVSKKFKSDTILKKKRMIIYMQINSILMFLFLEFTVVSSLIIID